MAESTVSRRVSEFVGVALFALTLVWLIALVTHEPTDPAWFFTTDAAQPPANFIGRVGAFLSELSFQLFGYASYLVPFMVAVVGWHYFWCQPPDAAYTKVFGVTLFFGCASSFLSLIFGSTQVAGKTFHAGGLIGRGSEQRSPSTSIAPARSSRCSPSSHSRRSCRHSSPSAACSRG